MCRSMPGKEALVQSWQLWCSGISRVIKMNTEVPRSCLCPPLTIFSSLPPWLLHFWSSFGLFKVCCASSLHASAHLTPSAWNTLSYCSQTPWPNRSPFLLLAQLLLSCFSCVRLCATPETAAHQAPPPPWDSPGKNTGVGCHFLL